MLKINKLELENVKRIKAVKLSPSKDGLTIIGGKNAQGKTSVLDAIAWALGGEKFRPSEAARKDSAIPPYLKLTMSNGLVVERKGKNSSLKVTDPSGEKAGQELLDKFVEKLALNLPKFMEASDKEKANTLLQIIGMKSELEALEAKEKDIYQERLYVGRIADQKTKFAAEQPYYPDAPEEPVSAAELIRQQEAILARNGENQRKRERLKDITLEKERIYDEGMRLKAQIKELQARLEERKEAYNKAVLDEADALKTCAELKDESTEAIKKSIENIEEINVKVRANLDKAKAEDDALHHQKEYTRLTEALREVREKKNDLLDHADLPLPGLSVKDGSLTYNGQGWDNMSGAERLKVAVAIVRKLNPECGFVLMDKIEQMDLETLHEFGEWLEQEGLQVIATRVSTGEECSIIIEDGYAIDNREEKSVPKTNWSKFEL